MEKITLVLTGIIAVIGLSSCPIEDDSNPIQPSDDIPITNIVINEGDFTTNVGATGTLTAIPHPSNHTDGQITWSSTMTDILTIDSNGNYTALSNGTVMVTATVGNQSNVVTVTVFNLATNITVSNMINIERAKFYTGTNTIFIERTEAIVYYTTNTSIFTNIYLYDNNSSNEIGATFLSNFDVTITNNITRTNIINSSSNGYVETNIIYSSNIKLISHITNIAETNETTSAINVVTNTNWGELDFSTTGLPRTSFSYLNFSNYNFSNANLRYVDFFSANLQNANLQGANLQNANLQGANLQNANLQGANLQNAVLFNADFVGANFAGANLTNVVYPPLAFSSSDFNNGASIPTTHHYTPPGHSPVYPNQSPTISWANIPPGTESLVIIIHDINGGNWVHWIAYDIPITVTNFARNTAKGSTVTIGSTNIKQGYSSYTGTTPNSTYLGYDGPILTSFSGRPSGVHNYVFTIYALNTNSYTPPTPSSTLNANSSSYYTAIINGLSGKIISSTNFTGTTSD